MKKVEKIILISILFFSMHQTAYSQLSSFGTEVQWYPAGYIATLKGAYGITEKSEILARVGYNLARRKDFSPESDWEEGGGAGFSLGYRLYLREGYSGLFVGAKADLWMMSIDWWEGTLPPEPAGGTSKTTVFQPSGEIGYMYQLPDSPIALGVNIAGGIEINVKTEGKPVGEGGITLLGFIVDYKF